MSNPNAVGQAFVQLQFEFEPRQLERQAQTAANVIEQKLRAAQGPARSAGQSVGNAFADGIQKGTQRAAGSIVGLIAQFNRMPNAAQSAASAASGAFNRIATAAANAGGQVTGVFRTLNSTFSGLTPVATAAAGGFTAIIGAATAVSAAGIDAASDLQNLEQSLKAIFGELSGTTEQTDAFIASLRELSKQSGQSFNQLGQTGRTLIATGLSAERTSEILTTFSKAAALSGASTRQFELALLGLTQVQAKGRLSSEELRRQIAENLPGAISVTKVYEQLAEQLDLTTKEVIKLQEAGGITADQGIQAILDAINETEGISEAFEARLSTLDGQLGVLKQTFTEVVQIGFKPFVSALAQGFDELRNDEAFADIQKELQDFSNVMGKVVVDAIKELLPIVPDLVKTFTELAEAVAPLVVDIASIVRVFLQLALPIINLTTDIINLVLNGLGPLSTIIRQLVAGALFGGLISLLGKLTGAFRLLGPVANGISRAFQGVANVAKEIAPAVGFVTAAIGLLQNAIEDILGPIVRFFDFLNLSLGPLKAFASGVKDVVGSVASGIGDFLGFNDEARELPIVLNESINPLNSFNTVFSQTLTLIRDARGILSLFGGTMNSIGNILGQTGDIIGGLVDEFGAELLSNALDPFVQAFENVESAGDRLKDATESVADAQKDLLKLLQEGRVDLEEVARATDRVTAATERLRDAEQSLAESRQGVADAIQDEIEATQALAEARQPATADELSEAEDNVTRARIALAQATREAKEAEDALNGTQSTRINLAGLSLDQIRTQLGNLKRSLAAQKAVESANESAGKTAEELEEEAILRQLDVRDAARSVQDAEEELQKVKLKGTDVDEAVIEAQEGVVEAARAVVTAKGEEEKAVRAVERAKRDEIAANKELEKAKLGDPEFDNKVAEARERITDAKEKEVIAQRELNKAIAEAVGDQDTLVRLKLDELRINKDLILQSPDLTAKFVASFGNLTDLLKGPINPKFLGPDFIRLIAEKLLTTPGSGLREVLKALGVPGLMSGGVVTNPMMARIGEFSKPEAVMPLTHPGNFFKTWQQSLPYMHPEIKQAFTPKPYQLGTQPKILRTSSAPSRSEKLLEAILAALSDAPEQRVEVPITVNAAPQMSEELLAWKLSRKIKRELRGR